MTKTQLLSAIDNHYPFNFDEMYQGVYDEDIFVAFLKNKQPILEIIKNSLITDKILLAAAENYENVTMMHLVKYKETSSYREIAMAALKKRASEVGKIDYRFLTEDIVIEACENNHLCFYEFLIRCPDLFNKTYPEEKLDEALALNPKGIESLIRIVFNGKEESEIVNERFIRKHIINSPKGGSLLINTKYRNIPVEMVMQGHWPIDVPKPASLAEACKMIMKPLNSTHHNWHKYFLMSHPLKDVVRVMRTSRSRVEVLQDLYSSEELAQHFKHNNRVKGMLLESDIGL